MLPASDPVLSIEHQIQMIKKLASYVIKAVAAYALVGFVVIPPLLNIGVVSLGKQVLTRELKLGAVYFNPFTLHLSFTALDIEKTAQIQSLSANLDWGKLPKLITGTNGQRTLHLHTVQTKAPDITFTVDKNGQNNFTTLLAVSEPKTADSTSQPAARNFQIQIDDTSIENGTLHLTDYQYISNKQPLSLNLTQTNLQASHLGWPTANTNLKLSTLVNGSGHIQGDLSLGLRENPENTQATGNIDLKGIELPIFQPIITQYVYGDLNRGSLDAAIELDIHNLKDLNVGGTIAIHQLQFSDAHTQENLLHWTQLQLNNVAYQGNRNRLTIDQLLLLEPATKIAIDEHLKVNLTQLIKPQPATPEQPDGTPFSIAINNLRLENGAMDFSDQSFHPGFAAPISELKGQIIGFDSLSKKPATITLHGQVDRFAPVAIKGSVSPSSPLSATDLTLSFKNLELSTLTPYSGRFAGYAIKKGRMNVDLNYNIHNRQLSAENKVLLDKLLLGKKVKSHEIVDLPIRLALALLKDRNGQIDLKLPVYGDLDDPQFRLGPVIRTALFNMITNIISAPFDFLGSLVGGDGNELKSINFYPGHYKIEQQKQMESLDKLARALKERPELNLEIAGKTSDTTDWPLVAQQLLHNQLKRLWIKDLHNKKKKVPKTLVLDTMDINTRQVLLKNIVAELNKKRSTPIVVKSSKVADIERLLIQQWPYNENAMGKLAIERATEIKDYLVSEGGIDPQRLYLLEVEHSKTDPQALVASELHVNAG